MWNLRSTHNYILHYAYIKAEFVAETIFQLISQSVSRDKFPVLSVLESSGMFNKMAFVLLAFTRFQSNVWNSAH